MHLSAVPDDASYLQQSTIIYHSLPLGSGSTQPVAAVSKCG
jgi:hypothetical protein